jgi:hypothetical protein
LEEWLRGSQERAREAPAQLTTVCEQALRLVIEETMKTLKVSHAMTFNDIADLSMSRIARNELAAR